MVSTMPSVLSAPLYEELWDAPKALLTQEAAKGRHLLVITESKSLAQAYKFFAEQTVLSFPAWETLPEEKVAPNPDIVGRRFETLHALETSKGPQVIIAPLQAVLTPVPEVAGGLVSWKKGETLPFGTLPNFLGKLGYERVPVVSDKGQFALRGGIIDIFPLSALDPYRVEFFGDAIDSIRTFDPISQRSLEKQTELLICPARETGNQMLLDLLNAEDTLVIFDDLLTMEDRLVRFPSLDFDAFFEKVQDRMYFTKDQFFKLSPDGEMFGRRLNAKVTKHDFFEIVDPTLLSECMEVTLVAANDGEKKAMGAIAPPHAKFKTGYLEKGFIRQNRAIFSYAEFSGRKKVEREKWRNTYHTPPSEFHELTIGDLVVHFHNGIGKYMGIEKQVNHLGQETEFMLIEYAKGGKLYAPLSQAHLISRYIGTSEEKPLLHTLGTKVWHKAKVKAEKAIVGYAKDLIKWQAMREHKGGFCYPDDGDDFYLFEEEFPYTETADQKNAIIDLKADMQSQKGMDRLICGDVGYGKTEVAMRAAAKAVLDGGKQVAVLVPTTVLAMQHYETFKERMQNFPIRVAPLSRFVKPKDAKKTLEQVAAGSIDILVGTHRLISKSVEFNDLGLIIIDEEQRFGVRAKEHLKKLKVGVECITLTATPIPRTLYFSLVGARDMSVINSPPQDRLPIKTILAERDLNMIKMGLTRELAHGGQAYFIHNRVESIGRVAAELQELMPNARIGIVHGQMTAHSIEDVFHEFKQGEIDILVATTIIESGIDIPNANTIFVDRAENYGLADLYQLRGRVGRWNRPSFAYFLTAKNKELSETAQKRLSALVEASGFGGGMKLAMRDLEIRGGGDLLGVQQSGHVSSIGFHLYCKLLKRAITSMKKHQVANFTETKMEFTYDANIPESYISEMSLRIEIYHKLGEASSLESAEKLLEELQDRFGTPPSQVIWLYHLTRIRIQANHLGYALLKFNEKTCTTDKSRFLLLETDDPSLLEAFVLQKLTTV